jgi:BlaI family penicillinase repressor
MSGRRPRKLTVLEAQIMDRVWDLGEATARQMQEALKPDKDLAYNTVQTMMVILRRKGFLKSRREGRADVYRPVIAREQVARRSLGELIDRFFSGSAVALVSQLVDEGEIGDGDLEALQREIEARRQKEHTAGGTRG